ncbi:MAG: tetratricopeptide repeat protein [Candidatus Gastranaerophilales bacterium]
MGNKTIKTKLLLSSLILLSLSGVPAMAYMTPEANLLYQQACSAEYKQDYVTATEKLLQALSLTNNNPMLLTKLAGVYTATEQYEEALKIYSQVVKVRPNDAFVYISVGSIYEDLGKYDFALKAYQRAMNIFPDYKYNFLNIANVQYQLGDFESAVDSYEKFLATYSQHFEARENLANSYTSLGAFKKAVKEYDALYLRDAAGFSDYGNYGLALYETAQYKNAVKMLEKAIELNPENVSSRIPLAMSYQKLNKNDLALVQYSEILKKEPDLHSIKFDYANLLVDIGEKDKAITNYNEYIKHYPKDYRAYQNLGIIYKKDSNWDLAIENLEKALGLQVGQDNLDLKKDLSACYHQKQDWEKALKYYDEILILTPNDYNVSYDKALALHALKKYNDAILIYSELLLAKKNNSVKDNLVLALISQGFVELGGKNYNDAIEHFALAVKYGTKDSEAYYGLAKSYRNIEQNDKASEFYEKAIALNSDKKYYSEEYAELISSTYKPDTTVVETPANSDNVAEVVFSIDSIETKAVSNKKAQGEATKPVSVGEKVDYIKAGDLAFNSKKYEEAILNYENALKANSRDAVTLLKLGNSYKLNNNLSKAILNYEKSVFVNPNYADGWFNLGLAQATNKDYVNAKTSFSNAIKIDSEYSYAYYALAIAYEKEGDNKNAIKNYKLFLLRNQDSETAEVVLKTIKNLEK